MRFISLGKYPGRENFVQIYSYKIKFSNNNKVLIPHMY